MGRYDKHITREPKDSDFGLHPIWRGIGCVLLVVLPIMAYAGSSLLIAANLDNGWIRIPREISGTIFIPFVNIAVPFLYAKLALTFVVLVIGYGVLIIFYSAFYRMVGPPKYGPTDAPPPKRPKGKRRRLR